MLMAANMGQVLTVALVVVCVIILIRILLLGGRFVRAVEKIADKMEKKA